MHSFGRRHRALLTHFVRKRSATISQPPYSRQSTITIEHAVNNYPAHSAYSAVQTMCVLEDTSQIWEIQRCGIWHGSHIARIPNQLSPVHRDINIMHVFDAQKALTP